MLTKENVFYLSIIFIVGLMLFSITFSTSVYGDEWKLFWLGESAIKHAGNILKQQSTDLSYLFEIIVFNLLSRIFGYNSAVYYIFSYICRTAAVLSLYWFLKKQNFTPLASFLGSLLFMITPVGIETTDWVRNFDSYLVIPLFLVAVDRTLKLNSSKNIPIVLLTLILIIFINTTRSHGVILTLIGLLSYKGLLSKPKRIIFFSTAAILLFTYLIFTATPIFGGQTSGLFKNFNIAAYIYSFFGNIGNVLIPDKSFQAGNVLILSSLLAVIFKGKFNRIFILISGLLISLFIWFYHLDFQGSFIIGAYFTAVFIYLILLKVRDKNYIQAEYLFLILIISFAFMLMPLARIPQIHANSEHRYLIFSALTIPSLVALVFNQNVKNRRLFLGILASFFILLTSYTLQSWDYLKTQNSAHNIKYTEDIWEQITHTINPSHNKKIPSVIILTDDKTYPKVVGSVAFGFNYHLGLINNVWENEKLSPVWVIVGNSIDKSQVPDILYSQDKQLYVLRITGENVADLTPKAKP